MSKGHAGATLVAVFTFGAAHAQPAKPVKPIAGSQSKAATPIKPMTAAKPQVIAPVAGAKQMKPMTPPAAIGADLKLTPPIRTQMIRDAVIAAGVAAPPQAPTPLARVTPISAGTGTARIELAVIGAFLGPGERRPNGAFNVLPEDKGGYLEIVLPTVTGKLHVIDCAASAPSGKLAFIVGNWEVSHSTLRDGHAMYAARATANTLRFRLVAPGTRPWSFHGCEITAMP